jgi:hypothetical protein
MRKQDKLQIRNKVNYISLSLVIFLIFNSCNSDKPSPKNENTISNSTVENDHLFLGKEHARQQILELMQRTDHSPFHDTLIRESSVAVGVAEPILFAKYGKEEILTERPYEVYLIDGYWYIRGTIPKGWKGGGFEIVLSSINGKIIKLTHYK